MRDGGGASVITTAEVQAARLERTGVTLGSVDTTPSGTDFRLMGLQVGQSIEHIIYNSSVEDLDVSPGANVTGKPSNVVGASNLLLFRYTMLDDTPGAEIVQLMTFAQP